MEANIDPYKILNIHKDYNLEQLKDAYKKMALKVHPDKGGSEYLFKLVTLCYKVLVKEYEKKNSDKQFHELKNLFQKEGKQPATTRVDYDHKPGFNIEKFNQIFDDNKLEDFTAIGYSDFLKANSANNTENILKGKKINNDSFNRQFEKHTKNMEPSKAVTKYKEPEALLTGKKIAYTELGVDNLDDFSGDNLTQKKLNYMDLKIAHTTSRIVDPNTVEKRPEYSTIDAIKTDRSKISYTMNDQERMYYDQKKLLEEKKERQRIETILKNDSLASAQFERLHKLMLGR